MTPDVARYMPAVAELLLGQPNRALSSDGEWRYGRHGSLSIKIAAGTFYDHEAGQGGGVLDLIVREQHCDRTQAMQWLLENVEGAADEATEGNGHAKAKLGRQVAAYSYVDERGELVFQVVRFDPKDFRQRRPIQRRPTAGRGRSRAFSPCPTAYPLCSLPRWCWWRRARRTATA